MWKWNPFDRADGLIINLEAHIFIWTRNLTTYVFGCKIEWNRKYLLLTNLLLTEREGRTGEYWPEVVAVWTERSEVRTKTTKGQYYDLFSARERAQFNKPCNLIGFGRGQNFPIRPSMHRVALSTFLNELTVIVNLLPFLDFHRRLINVSLPLFTFKWQGKSLSVTSIECFEVSRVCLAVWLFVNCSRV